MRKFVTYLVVIVLCIVALGLAAYTTSKVTTKGVVTTQSKASAKVAVKNSGDNGVSAGDAIAFGILVVAVIGIIANIVYDAHKRRKNWREALAHSVFYGIIGLVIVNAIIALRFKDLWVWYHDRDWVFFWSTNLLVIVLIFLGTKNTEDTSVAQSGVPKMVEHKTARRVAWVVLFILVASIVAQLKRFPIKDEVSMYAGPGNQATQTFVAGVDKAAILEIVGGCESNNKQFGSDGKPLRNRTNPGAVGRWQINLSNKAVASEVEAHGWDVEHKEEDNKAAAEYLYDKYGLRPWSATRSCWEPQLALAKRGGNATVEESKVEVLATPLKYSQLLKVPARQSFQAKSETGEAYLVRANGDPKQVILYDPQSRDCFSERREVMDRSQCFVGDVRSLEFMSVSNKAIKVVVEFFPYKRI